MSIWARQRRLSVCALLSVCVPPWKPAGFVCVATTATRTTTTTTTTHPQKTERERRGEPSLRMNESFLLFVSLNKSLQIIALIRRMTEERTEEGDGTNSTGRGRTVREELISRPWETSLIYLLRVCRAALRLSPGYVFLIGLHWF